MAPFPGATDKLVVDELQLVNGVVPLPRKPGRGVELSPEAVERYCASRVES